MDEELKRAFKLHTDVLITNTEALVLVAKELGEVSRHLRQVSTPGYEMPDEWFSERMGIKNGSMVGKTDDKTETKSRVDEASANNPS